MPRAEKFLPSREERFMSRVRKEENGCWIWTAGLMGNGYGFFAPAHGAYFSAHRWSYMHFRGPIPDGLALDHLCRTRACVNPDHLEPVTLSENQRRGSRPPHTLPRPFCGRGHEMNGDNVGFTQQSRYCRACGRIRGQERSRLRREQRAQDAS